jgi:hypothetical protein
MAASLSIIDSRDDGDVFHDYLQSCFGIDSSRTESLLQGDGY